MITVLPVNKNSSSILKINILKKSIIVPPGFISERGAVTCAPPAQAPPPARFAPTYVLLDNPHPDWQGGLLFRAFPGDWALAAAGFGGALTVHGRAAERPSLPDIDRGFQAVRDDNNPFSRAVGAAAALRRRGEPDEAE